MDVPGETTSPHETNNSPQSYPVNIGISKVKFKPSIHSETIPLHSIQGHHSIFDSLKLHNDEHENVASMFANEKKVETPTPDINGVITKCTFVRYVYYNFVCVKESVSFFHLR
jgi:hypothetical protein